MNAEISQRERGMAERRARIVEAARDLIRATGDTGLSMRALAERAGVSLATPYNLFGSKQAVMLGVLEADLAAFRAGLDAAGPGDPLRRLFDNVALAARFYDEDPGFYRALFTALAGAGGPELRLLFGAAGSAGDERCSGSGNARIQQKAGGRGQKDLTAGLGERKAAVVLPFRPVLLRAEDDQPLAARQLQSGKLPFHAVPLLVREPAVLQ